MKVTTQELATMLNMTRQRVHELIREGILPKSDDARHDPYKSIPAYIRFIKDGNSNKSLDAARQRKLELESEMRELKLREKKGELIDVAIVKKRAFERGRTIRDAMLNVPDRIAGMVAAEQDQQKCHTIILKEIHSALTGIIDDGKSRPSRPRRAVNL